MVIEPDRRYIMYIIMYIGKLFEWCRDKLASAKLFIIEVTMKKPHLFFITILCLSFSQVHPAAAEGNSQIRLLYDMLVGNDARICYQLK